MRIFEKASFWLRNTAANYLTSCQEAQVVWGLVSAVGGVFPAWPGGTGGAGGCLGGGGGLLVGEVVHLLLARVGGAGPKA